MLYFAYGSNLNKEQMHYRCPDAIHLYPVALKDYQLVFRKYADIEFKKGAVVHGALWDVTKKCISALDRYEGVENDLYVKKYFLMNDRKVLWYKMNNNVIIPPSRGYFKTIVEGFDDFGIPHDALNKAKQHSIKNQTVFDQYDYELNSTANCLIQTSNNIDE